MPKQDHEQHEQQRQNDREALANQEPTSARHADIGGLREDVSVDINDVSERRGRATIGEREDLLRRRRIPSDAGRPGPSAKPKRQSQKPGGTPPEHPSSGNPDQEIDPRPET